MDTNILVALEPRARLIGSLVAGSGVYRWGDYIRCEPLDSHYSGDASMVYFTRRPPIQHGKDAHPRIEFGNLAPREVTGLRTESVTVLESRKIDALHLDADNLAGATDQALSYEATFGETVSREDAWKAGVKTAITQTIKVGGETSPVSSETTLSVESWFEGEGRSSRGETVERRVTIPVVCPVGVRMRFTAVRSVERVRERVVGCGDWQHSVTIGGHKNHGGWHGKRHGRAYWTVLDDLVRLLQGHGPWEWDLAHHLAGLDISTSVLDKLSARKVPFVLDLEYDSVTGLKVQQQVLERA